MHASLKQFEKALPNFRDDVLVGRSHGHYKIQALDETLSSIRFNFFDDSASVILKWALDWLNECYIIEKAIKISLENC